jgi:hypothetical protein
MELHDAILYLKKYQGYLPISKEEGVRKHAFDLTDETVDALLAALSRAAQPASHAADSSFEDFLTERNDEIDRTAFALLCALSGSKLAWDMEKIGTLVDSAEALLAERGVDTCRPFYEGDEEVPCISGTDCKNPSCAFRAKREKAS